MRDFVSPEEYLTTVFEGPDREFLDGEIVERSMPDYAHGKCQVRFAEIVYELKKKHPLHAVTEVRHRVANTRYHIPDVAIHYGPEPSDRVPASPPLVAIEIISADDRYSNILKKLHEYEAWGVAHIWVVDPEERSLSILRDGRLERVTALDLPEFGVSLEPGEIFR